MCVPGMKFLTLCFGKGLESFCLPRWSSAYAGLPGCPVVVAQGARGVPRGSGGPVAGVHRCRPGQEALRAGPGPQAGAAGDAQALQQGVVRLSF